MWEWSIHNYSLSAMLIHPIAHNSRNQECVVNVLNILFEKHICNQSSHYGKYGWCCVPQLSSETEVSIALLCQLCSTRYTAVRIKNCLKSTSVIKVTTMEITDNFRYAKEAIMCNHQINAFHCQHRWMEHKGGHW